MDSIVFWGFNLYAWITIATVLTMFTVLLLTKLRADLVFLGAISILFVTGVLSAKEAFSGFSSTSVVIIGVLFVVVAGLTHTGVLQWIVKHLLGQPNSYSKAVIRLMLPVAALSSFLSNTTVVALFVGIVKMWSKKLDISPSKLLIPLSYASGMGGVCTLIGTPPNLIISGLYADHTGTAMNVLATTIPGLFCLFIGVLSIIAMRQLLPDRKAPGSDSEDTAEYTDEQAEQTGYRGRQHVHRRARMVGIETRDNQVGRRTNQRTHTTHARGIAQRNQQLGRRNTQFLRPHLNNTDKECHHRRITEE